MRSSSEILKAIRKDVFEETQKTFGKRLPLAKETISRLESGSDEHQVTRRHLRLLRGLRAPKNKAEQLQSLLSELEAALWREMTGTDPVEPGAQDGPPLDPLLDPSPSSNGPEAEERARAAELDAAERAETLRREAEARHAELVRRGEEFARRAEAAAERGEQALRQQEVWCAEEARRREETVQRIEAAAERVEEEARRREEAVQRIAAAAERAEDEARKREEAVQRIAAAAERAEQLRREDEARREEEAERMARAALEAERVRDAARRRGLVAIAASAALGLLVGGVSQMGKAVSRHPPDDADVARAGDEESVNPGVPPGGTEPAFEKEPTPEEEFTSAGLDAGTALVRMLRAAIPMPKTGFPGQLAAPCPEHTEELNGYCWRRFALSPQQVKDGFCEELSLYEPSSGWCRKNHAGYRPYLGARRNNNVVDP